MTLVFNVTVPATTDGTGRTVNIAGFLDRLDGGFPQWDAGGAPLTRVDATHWTITFTGKEATQLEYKYTLGSFDFVEKDGSLRRDRQPAAHPELRRDRHPDRQRHRAELAQRGALRQLSEHRRRPTSSRPPAGVRSASDRRRRSTFSAAAGDPRASDRSPPSRIDPAPDRSAPGRVPIRRRGPPQPPRIGRPRRGGRRSPLVGRPRCGSGRRVGTCRDGQFPSCHLACRTIGDPRSRVFRPATPARRGRPGR